MIITLEQAKANLQVDFDDDNAVIERCIKSAISWVEKYTGYILNEGVIKVYADKRGIADLILYPFEVITPNIIIHRKATSSILRGKSNEEIELKVGNWGNEEPPTDIVEACYKLITYFYENRDMYTVTLPTDIQMLLNQYRRSCTI